MTKKLIKVISIIMAVLVLTATGCKKKSDTNVDVAKMVSDSEKTIAVAVSNVSVMQNGIKVRGYKTEVEVGGGETVIRETNSTLDSTLELKDKVTVSTVTDFKRADIITFSFEKYIYKTYTYSNGKLTATVSKDRVDNVIGKDVLAVTDGKLTANFTSGKITSMTFAYDMQDENGKTYQIILEATYSYNS